MSILNLTGLKKSFNTEVILNGITGSVERGEKIALVGQNGAGKSTLLKIISKELTEDGGQIAIPPHIKVAYLPQTIESHFNLKISDFITYSLGSDSWPYQVNIMLSGFGLDGLDLNRKISTLSSGEQSKLALVVTLIKNADLYLLDEPTNNLDLPTIIWLTEYLKNQPAACLIVSHDRHFLDQLVTKVWHLDPITKKAIVQKGNYSQYLDNEIRKIKAADRAYVEQETKVAQLRIDVARNYAHMRAGQKWVGNDNDKMLRGYYRNKAGKSGRRAEVLTGRIERITVHERPIPKENVSINFQNSENVSFLKLSQVTFVNKPINLGPLNIAIEDQQRFLIIGENGVGKSTLLKLIGGELKLSTGKREASPDLILGVLNQIQQKWPPAETVLASFKTATNISSNNVASDYLKNFRIKDRDAKRAISLVSPGTKMKLALAIITATAVNCLVLDEPTNHLDLDSTVALVDGLNYYTGALVVVSHDLSFIKDLKVNHIFLLDNGQLVKITSLEAYLEQAQLKAQKLLRIIK